MGSGHLGFISVIITNASLHFFIYKIKTRKRAMLFTSTTHQSSGEADKCSKCKYLRPTRVQRNLNLGPESKNLWGYLSPWWFWMHNRVVESLLQWPLRPVSVHNCHNSPSLSQGNFTTEMHYASLELEGPGTESVALCGKTLNSWDSLSEKWG